MHVSRSTTAVYVHDNDLSLSRWEKYGYYFTVFLLWVGHEDAQIFNKCY